jgi:type IV pilus assembly protein PilA
MFIRMKESKGFTLVELMIVVAIIGILAAVAVPYYQKYIQRSRLTSLVMPGVHATQTNIASYFSLNNNFPTGATVGALLGDADSAYYSVAVANTGVTFTLSKEGNASSPLHALAGSALVCSAVITNGGMIGGWVYSGNIAATLGLGGIQ